MKTGPPTERPPHGGLSPATTAQPELVFQFVAAGAGLEITLAAHGFGSRCELLGVNQRPRQLGATLLGYVIPSQSLACCWLSKN